MSADDDSALFLVYFIFSIWGLKKIKTNATILSEFQANKKILNEVDQNNFVRISFYSVCLSGELSPRNAELDI